MRRGLLRRTVSFCVVIFVVVRVVTEGDCPPLVPKEDPGEEEPTSHSQEADSVQEPQTCGNCCTEEEEAVVGEDPDDCGFPTDASLKAMEITTQARIAIDEAREEMLVRAAIHVKLARV